MPKLNVLNPSKTKGSKLCPGCWDTHYGPGKYCSPFCKRLSLAMSRMKATRRPSDFNGVRFPRLRSHTSGGRVSPRVHG